MKAEFVEPEESESKDDVEAHARAHLAIACSTPAEMAPRRPPKTDELEDDEEEDEEEAELTDAREAGLG